MRPSSCCASRMMQRERRSHWPAAGQRRTELLDASTAHRVDPHGTMVFRKWRPISRGRLRCRAKLPIPAATTGAIGLLRPARRRGARSARLPGHDKRGQRLFRRRRTMIEAMIVTAVPPSSFTARSRTQDSAGDRALRRAVAAADLHPLGRAFPPGVLVAVPLYLDDLPGKPSGADLRDALRAFYEGSEHVTVAVGNGANKLEPEALNGTDRLDLYVWANEPHRQAVLVARLDNLGKGASGAAVQNLRLMLDLEFPAWLIATAPQLPSPRPSPREGGKGGVRRVLPLHPSSSGCGRGFRVRAQASRP